MNALRQRFDRNKRCRRAERAALHAHEVHELADRWMDRPVERVPRQVPARIPQAQAPSRRRRKALLCDMSARYGVRHGGIRSKQNHPWFPGKEYPSTSSTATPLTDSGFAEIWPSDTVAFIKGQYGRGTRATSAVRKRQHKGALTGRQASPLSRSSCRPCH